jgi:PEP-CTERM motif
MKTKSSKAGLPGMRYLLAGAAVASTLAISAVSASAAPIDLQGYGGQVAVKFVNYESFSATQTLTNGVTAPAVGSDNYGIFVVSSVSAVNNASDNFLNGSPYTYVGVFNDIDTTSATGFSGASGTGFVSDTTGGTFVLYQIPTVDINVPAVISQGIEGFTTGTCTVAGAAGGFCYNGITNVAGATEVLTYDLTSDLAPEFTALNGSGKVANFGQASANATITGGSDAGQFGGIGSALSVGDNFCFQGGGGSTCAATGPANDFELFSNDPVILTAVPEPAPLALFGAGLLGLGLLYRRRQKRNTGLIG